MFLRLSVTIVLTTLFVLAVSGRGIAVDEVGPLPIDPAISAAVAKVSADRLREIDTRLVAFGTRNGYSETLHNPKRGVYAARDWLAAQFRNIGGSGRREGDGGRLRPEQLIRQFSAPLGGLDQSVLRPEILGRFTLPVMSDVAAESQTCPYLEWG